MTKQISKTESEWRADLTDEQYNVCRCGGTEAPFTGKYWDCKTAGIYHCAACDAALFSSATKFDSGTGWPSFFDKLSPEAVGEKT
ncbi:MAG: peptide-methionine (R)-S-oxide reductase, partial [Kordiimonadaceae bacterium]|nr:peptide-methionine (R)-S-oxide reductase [Kordiimonadaceae bacterium]